MNRPYESGWCTQCGMRRGADGRCSNCDPWWTSPLIQVGGPIVAVFALLMAVLVVRFGGTPSPSRSGYTAYPGATRRGASPAAPWASTTPNSPGAGVSSPASLGPAAPYAAPAAPPRVTVFPPTASAPAGGPPPPDPEAMLFADLERLRGIVWNVDAIARGRSGGTFFANPFGSGPARLQTGS